MKDEARLMNMFQSTMNNMNGNQRLNGNQSFNMNNNIPSQPQLKRTIGNSYSTSPQLGGPTKKRRIGVSMSSFTAPLGKSWWRYGEIQKDVIQNLMNQRAEPISQTLGAQHVSTMYGNTSSAATSRVVSVDNLSLPGARMALPTPKAISSIIQSLQTKGNLNPRVIQHANINNTNVPVAFGNASFSPAVMSQAVAIPNPVMPNPFFRQEATFIGQDAADNSVDEDDDEDDDDCSEDSTGLKFRAYQAENWTEKFEELIEFRNHFGHCLVPNAFPENPALAQWVKRQRYQYKLKAEGKRSTMSDERVTALEEIGFVWDSHSAIWDERLQDLLEYKQVNGHCNVPSRYAENRQLAVWVKRQRRQYKFFCEGEPSSMTEQRIERLNAIGFEWDLRQKK